MSQYWYKNTFCPVKCDSEDGKGCGHRWLEGYGLYHLMCPKCGRLVVDGNNIWNDEDAPRVDQLDDPSVLEAFDEVEL